MNESGMNWDKLNAYVDGELPPEEAAAVAEAVAREPAIARQVAALTALKAAVVDTAPAYPGKLRLAAHRRRDMLLLPGVAVASLLVAVLLVAGWFAELHRPAPSMALAEQVHREWAATPRRGADGTAAEPLKVALNSLKLAYVPDLTQVQLVFDGVREVEARGAPGLHVGYLGPRGCAVSLVVFEHPGHREAPLAAHGVSDRPAWSWATGGASFYLLAPGMDPRRLAGIARIVQQLTRARLPLDAEGVLALDQARNDARPCTA